MTRSRLKNTYLKTRNSKIWENCKKQRNFCTTLLKKTKSEYFHNLNIKPFFLSIKKIKQTYKIAETFYLKKVSSEEVKKVIKSMNKKKSVISSCIPVKVLIGSVDRYLPTFTDIINSSIRNGTFPEGLKLAEVTPLFKKADPFDKVNYRPVSLLPHVSKASERIIFNQISTFFEPHFSGLLTGFYKNYNTQHSLLKLLELWKEALDKGKSVGAIFMDLSKLLIP